ncbi:MAG: LysR family transcriptional regulator [Pseudomonadota bacterium]
MHDIAFYPAPMQDSSMPITADLNWDDLKLLLALAEGGVVARAAERLRSDPTTVTRRLRKLEQNTGIALVERVKGGVILSKSGMALVEVARSTQEKLGEAFKNSGQDELSGTVKLSGTDFLLDLIAPVIAQMSWQHPDMMFDLKPTNAYLSLDRRETDVALRIAENPSPGLFGRNLGRLSLGFYAVAELAERQRGLPWLSWNLPRGLTEIETVIFSFDPDARIVARLDSMMGQARLAALGCGVAILPDLYMQSRSEMAHLVRIGSASDADLWVLTHEELKGVPRIKYVMHSVSDALLEAIAECEKGLGHPRS